MFTSTIKYLHKQQPFKIPKNYPHTFDAHTIQFIKNQTLQHTLGRHEDNHYLKEHAAYLLKNLIRSNDVVSVWLETS